MSCAAEAGAGRATDPLWVPPTVACGFRTPDCLARACAFLSGVVSVFLTQIRQGRGRLGEEDSDVDIEGFDEDEDGKPKTPAPVSISEATRSPWVAFRSCGGSCWQCRALQEMLVAEDEMQAHLRGFLRTRRPC